MPIQISIIIPYHREKDSLKKCLKAVENSSYKQFEVIIVNDAAYDKFSFQEKYKFPLKILVNTYNKGGGYSRNQGAKAASGKILLFIDADVLIKNNTLANLKNIFAENETIAAVIGCYDKNIPHKNLISNFKNLFHHFNHQQAKEQASTFWTGCGAIRKETFFKAGLFSEHKRINPIEDIELGYRLYKKNLKILLNKNILVTHLKKYNWLSFIHSEIFLRALPWTYIILQEKMVTNNLNTSLKYFLSVFLTYIMLFSSLLYPLFLKTAFFTSFSSFILILYLNHKFYALAIKEKGYLFFLNSLMLTFIHFLCCGLGLLWGIFIFYKDKGRG